MLTNATKAQTHGVPFFDLAASHASLRSAVADDFARLIDSGAFVNGPALSTSAPAAPRAPRAGSVSSG